MPEERSAVTESWDAVIVGGGSAGLACALTLSRALRRTLVIDAGAQRNRTAPHSHGVLGSDGAPPTRLIAEARSEVESFGGSVRDGAIRSAEVVPDGFRLESDDGDRIVTRQLVIATGVTDELPAVPGVRELWGSGVVVCPYCDGWEVRGGRIGVLASGAKSIAQAQLVRQWSDDVTFFSNGAVTLSARDELEFASRGIRIVDDLVAGIEQQPGERVEVRTNGQQREFDIVFTAPRAVANDGLLRQLGAVAAGEVAVVDRHGATETAGLWAVGNVVDASLKIPTALGNGMAVGTHVNEAMVRDDIARAMSDFSAD